jgi:hypothetical protein
VAKDDFDKVAKPTVLEKIAETRKTDKPRANDQHKPTPPQLVPGQSSTPRGQLGPSQTQLDEAQRNKMESRERLEAQKRQKKPGQTKPKDLSREFNKHKL